MSKSCVSFCSFLVHKLTANDCLFLARRSGLSEVEIQDIRDENPYKVKEQKYQLLLKSLDKKTSRQIHNELQLELDNSAVAEEFENVFHTSTMNDSGDVANEGQAVDDDFSIAAHCHGMDFLTSEYVDRPTETEDLVNLVKGTDHNMIGIIGGKGCTDSNYPYIRKPNPVGIQGLGGWGKTTVAKAVAQKLCKYCRMEVVWLTVSQTADILRLFNTMHLYLTGKKENFPDEKAGQEWLREFTKTYRMLLVLDDVWNEKDVIPFNVLGPNSRLLITTRIERVLTFNNSKVYELGSLDNAQSKQMLLNYAGVDEHEIRELRLTDLVEKILECLKNFPLAIAVIGSVLRRMGKTKATCRKWQRILGELQNSNEFWEKKAHTLTTQSYSLSVYGAFDVSFDNLGINPSSNSTRRDLQSKFLDFALFPEDTPIPVDVLLNFWMLDRRQSHDTSSNARSRTQLEEDLETLEESSLINSCTMDENGEEYCTVHDLVLQYACHKFEVEYGVGSLQKRHGTFLDYYTSSLPWQESLNSANSASEPAPWWMIENDGYIYKLIVHHLLNAGMEKEVGRLLLKYTWIQKKLEETDIAAVLSDFSLYIKHCTSTQVSINTGIRLMYDSLQLIARVVAKDSGQLPLQLMASLIGLDNPEIKEVLKQIQDELDLRKDSLLVPRSTCLTQPGGSLKRAIVDNKAKVLSVAFTHDNKRIVAGLGTGEYKNARVVVIDIDTGREHVLGQETDHHKGLVFGLAIHPEDRFVLTASFDMTLKMWPLDHRKGGAVTTLKGHVNNVYCVAMAKHGAIAVSGSKDQTIKKWDLERRECSLTMIGHRGIVRHLCITNKGDKIVSGSEDGTVRIWCLENGCCLKEVDSRMKSVYQVSITRDDHTVFAVGPSREVKMVDLGKGVVVKEIECNSGEITSCCVTRNGRHLLAGMTDGNIQMLPITQGERSHLLPGHTGIVRCISASGDGSMLASASEDCSIKIWDCAKIGKGTVHDPVGHSTAVSAMAIAGCGNMALSASHDCTVKLWDLRNFQNIHTFRGHTERVNCIAVSQALCCGISGSDDRTIRVWDVVQRRSVCEPLEGHLYSVTSLHATSVQDRNILLSGSTDNTVIVWDLDKQVILSQLVSQFCDIQHLSTSIVDESQLEITAAFRHAASKWKISLSCLSSDKSSSDELSSLTSESSSVPSCVHRCPVVERHDTNGFILGWDEMSRIRFWHLDNRIESMISSGHEDDDLVTALFLTPDDALLICGSESGNINIIGLQKTESLMGRIEKPEVVNSKVTALFMLDSVSDNQETVMFFAGFADGTVSYWKTCDRHAVYACGRTPFPNISKRSTESPNTHDIWHIEPTVREDSYRKIGELRSAIGHLVAFSDHGMTRLLCSSQYDPKIVMFGVQNCEVLKTFDGHVDAITSLFMVHPGFLLSGSVDGTARLWNLESGHCRIDQSGFGGQCGIRTMAVTPDKKQYITGSVTNVMQLHDVSTGERVESMTTGSNFNMKSMAVFSDGKRINCCYDNYVVEGRDLETNEVKASMVGHQSSWGNTTTTFDGETMLSTSEHCGLKIWNAATGSVLGYLGKRNEPSAQHTDALTGEDTHLDHHTRQVTAIKVHKTNVILTGSYDNSLRVWKADITHDKYVYRHITSFTFEHAVTAIDVTSNDVVCIGLLNGQVCFLKLSNL